MLLIFRIMEYAKKKSNPKLSAKPKPAYGCDVWAWHGPCLGNMAMPKDDAIGKNACWHGPSGENNVAARQWACKLGMVDVCGHGHKWLLHQGLINISCMTISISCCRHLVMLDMAMLWG
jgi:hypothetical protein